MKLNQMIIHTRMQINEQLYVLINGKVYSQVHLQFHEQVTGQVYNPIKSNL
jgi:hypothetical protein